MSIIIPTLEKLRFKTVALKKKQKQLLCQNYRTLGSDTARLKKKDMYHMVIKELIHYSETIIKAVEIKL